MPNFVKSIEAIGVYGRFDIKQTFNPNINILYGNNGSGKTTLLHILANALNEDYQRFLYLDFVSIEIHNDDGTKLKIKWSKPNDNDSDRKITVIKNGHRRGKNFRKPKNQDDNENYIMNYSLKVPVAYFPAFRSMIEAWISVKEEDFITNKTNKYLSELEENINSIQVQTTRFSRKLFGQFVPRLNYPSPLEIEQRLIDEIRVAILTVAQVDRELLSKSFVDILATLSSSEQNKQLDNSEMILQEIQSISEEIQSYPLQDSMLASDVNSKLHEMLNPNRFESKELNHFFSMMISVYRDSLKKIVDVQKKSFAVIDKYLTSVNKFLEGKKLEVREQDEASPQPSIQLIFDDGSSGSIRALSSGERQIITLLYAATHMSQQNLVLIDEPEISLHVDWQRLLLKQMSEQLGNRQIIACTHSPVIPADYEDNFVELNLIPTDKSSWYPNSDDDIDDDIDDDE